MRNRFFYFLLSVVSVFLWSGCKDGRQNISEGFQDLEKDFGNPPSEYRPAPLTVWNGKITDAEVIRMLEELKEAGFGGGFIHPRSGLISEYLSDEWNSFFRLAADFGKKNDMKIWVYDENSCPSGFAGGHVPAEMPESYNQGQGLKLTRTDVLPDDTAEFYIFLKKENDKWIDITDHLSKYKGQKGEYYLYSKTYHQANGVYAGYSYVDLLAKGVTEKFIEVTMSGYEKVAKEYFGNVVPGVFSDEPNIGAPRSSFRWTPDLFEVFQARWGYDLKPLIPLLEEETGNWKQVRHDYYSTLLQLFVDRWSKPYHEYCEKNNLKWTGHYWEHTWPEMNGGPDEMAMYAWHQQPGIDMLWNVFREDLPDPVGYMFQFGNVKAVKELRSVANQMGRRRTLSETYGGGGWDETFKDFKRLGDWEFVLGVNFMNQHLAHMSMSGARKNDYPPEFSYRSPWWPNYRLLNDYFGRLSSVLSKGLQKNDILILEPNSTIWSYSSYTKRNPYYMVIGKSFQSFVTKLEKMQVEYDLGSENVIKDHGSVDGKKFVVGKAAYSMVVLPPLMENLDRRTYELLDKFVKKGGKLLCYSKPTRIDGIEDERLASLFKGPAVINLSSEKEGLEHMFAHTGCSFSFKGGNLFHQRRIFKDGELFFLVNSSMDEAVDGTLSSTGKSIVRMDAENGKIYSYPSAVSGNKITTDFHIEPAGSMLLYVSDSDLAASYAKEPQKAGNNKLMTDSKLKIKRLQDNVLNISFLDLNVKNKQLKEIYYASASETVFREHGFKWNPWNLFIQYKQEHVVRDTFKTGGYDAVYRFQVNDRFDYSKMKLVTEHPELFQVKINGKSIKANPGEWWFDKSFGVYSIGKDVKKGINEVELSIHPMSVYAELEPVYILGDFSVVPEEKDWSISAPVKELKLGSWKEQKQPFYSWGVSYSKDYDISDTGKKYAVQLNEWNGTVAEVYVNGKKAGIIASNPYRLDVSSYLKKGSNNIDVHVIGSLKNLYGPHYNNRKPGQVFPQFWRNRIWKKIPGKSFFMLDYGMMEDFDLVY